MKCEVSGRKLVEWEIREINGMPLIVCPDFDACDQGQPMPASPPEEPADPVGGEQKPADPVGGAQEPADPVSGAPGPDEIPDVPPELPAESTPAQARSRRGRS